MDNIKVMDRVWLAGTVGVIKAKDTITNEIKIYIGRGLGESEQEDIKDIILLGTKTSVEDIQKLAKWASSDKAR